MIRIISVLVLALALSAPAVAALAQDARPPLTPEEISIRTVRLPPALRLEIAGLQYLLTDDELHDLLAYPGSGRCRRWIDRWWRQRDPVYTTRDNEIRAQHEARVAQAREWYRNDKWPGWDQRGEVQIRYGTPLWRSVRGKDVAAKGIERASELWSYPALGMMVFFEDAYGSGEYTYLIEHVELPAGRKPASDRTSIGSDFIGKTDMTALTVDQSLSAMIASALVPDPGLEFEYDSPAEQINRFFEVKESHPALFPSDYDFMRIPLYFDVACFRGGDGVSRVDVNAQFLANLVAPEPITHKRYRATAVFWDSDGSERGRKSTTIDIPAVAPEGPAAAGRFHVAQITFGLPPDFYHMAITVEEPLTGRFESQRGDVTCRAFDRFLRISDIVCAARIAPISGDSPFNRGALFVLPHPMARYAETASIPFYFEVYNLQPARGGGGEYTVSYRLIPETPRPLGLFDLRPDDSPLDVASRFTSTCPGSKDAVHVSIGTENLWRGRYRLEVEITDENSNAQVTGDVTFELTGQVLTGSR